MSDLGTMMSTSHHAMWDKCLFWKRADVGSNSDLNSISHELKPKGIFYARPYNDFNQTDQTVGSFVFESNEVTIETNDDVSDLKTKDLVLFCSRLWNVINVTTKVYPKQRQFSESGIKACVISLRR